MRTQRDEPGRGPSPGSESAGTLILGSPAGELQLLSAHYQPPPHRLLPYRSLNELREAPLHMEKKELLFELGFLQGVPPQLWEEMVTPTPPQKENREC